MKHFIITVLAVIAASVSVYSQPKGGLRPYSEWEATQFVALTGHQPSDYVTTDNNWEIVYALRNPMTASELRNSGITCSDSQLMLLEVGGIIERHGGKWQTVIPILDQQQTKELRNFAREVAADIYKDCKTDFKRFAETADSMGYGRNVLSLTFSYLLDGRMWTKLFLFDDFGKKTTWSGCYWVLYEPRQSAAYGTNGYGEQDLCLTYLDSRIAPGVKTMEHLADEIRQNGKVCDAELAKKLAAYGLVDTQGNAIFPIIRQKEDSFHQTTERLVNAISTGLKGRCGDMSSRFGFREADVAVVALYHEVMWELMDALQEDGIVTVPGVFKDAKTNSDKLNETVFFVEGGLMQ